MSVRKADYQLTVSLTSVSLARTTANEPVVAVVDELENWTDAKMNRHAETQLLSACHLYGSTYER